MGKQNKYKTGNSDGKFLFVKKPFLELRIVA
jgi:hypothetical protein